MQLIAADVYVNILPNAIWNLKGTAIRHPHYDTKIMRRITY